MIAAPSRHRRRRLPLTPLIDVIFLLLLFFMLSSTFLRFADIEVVAAEGSRGASPPSGDVALLKLRYDGTLALAGRTVALSDLAAAIAALPEAGVARLILTADRGSSVQALVDTLEMVEAGPVPIILAAPPDGAP